MLSVPFQFGASQLFPVSKIKTVLGPGNWGSCFSSLFYH